MSLSQLINVNFDDVNFHDWLVTQTTNEINSLEPHDLPSDSERIPSFDSENIPPSAQFEPLFEVDGGQGDNEDEENGLQDVQNKMLDKILEKADVNLQFLDELSFDPLEADEIPSTLPNDSNTVRHSVGPTPWTAAIDDDSDCESSRRGEAILMDLCSLHGGNNTTRERK
jgi:hypothetical protein